MANLDLDNRRPCIVEGKKAMFHDWTYESQIVYPSASYGDHTGGVVSSTLGIVEFEDGTVKVVEPKEIKFVDGGGFDEIYFGEVDNGNN